MIKTENGVFFLETKNTSYLFRVTSRGHLEHIHYGARVSSSDAEALCLKNTIMLGTTVAYDAKDTAYSLETLPQEYSGIGKGDYRHTPMEMILADGSFVTDFVYESHSISSIPATSEELPFATGKADTLTVVLADKKYPKLKLELSYTVFEECNVIARHAKLCNGGEGEVYIRKLMSFMFDLPRADYTMLTLDGGWTKEAHIHERPVSYGLLINDSTTGDSSNRHNPAFMLKKIGANEEW